MLVKQRVTFISHKVFVKRDEKYRWTMGRLIRSLHVGCHCWSLKTLLLHIYRLYIYILYIYIVVNLDFPYLGCVSTRRDGSVFSCCRKRCTLSSLYLFPLGGDGSGTAFRASDPTGKPLWFCSINQSIWLVDVYFLIRHFVMGWIAEVSCRQVKGTPRVQSRTGDGFMMEKPLPSRSPAHLVETQPYKYQTLHECSHELDVLRAARWRAR